jgi:hypothetical protein
MRKWDLEFWNFHKCFGGPEGKRKGLLIHIFETWKHPVSRYMGYIPHLSDRLDESYKAVDRDMTSAVTYLAIILGEQRGLIKQLRL